MRDVQKRLAAVADKQKAKNLDVKFELAFLRRQVRQLARAMFRLRQKVEAR